MFVFTGGRPKKRQHQGSNLGPLRSAGCAESRVLASCLSQTGLHPLGAILMHLSRGPRRLRNTIDDDQAAEAMSRHPREDNGRFKTPRSRIKPTSTISRHFLPAPRLFRSTPCRESSPASTMSRRPSRGPQLLGDTNTVHRMNPTKASSKHHCRGSRLFRSQSSRQIYNVSYFAQCFLQHIFNICHVKYHT